MCLKYIGFLLILVVTIGLSNGASNGDTLVLLDSMVTTETHSLFFESLRERGYNLTFKSADDAGLSIWKYGDYLYKNLIIFAPGVEEFGGDLNLDKLTEFVDNGGNVLVAVTQQSGDVLREFASECGMEVDEENSSVIDHLNFDLSDAGDHTTTLTDAKNLIDAPIIVGSKHSNPLIYRGTGLLADKENPLVLRLLTGENTSFSYNPTTVVKEYPHVIGKGTLLIAALQARNNARVVFSGSLHFFSNEAFTMRIKNAQKGQSYKNSSNLAVATAISKWVFGERGRLRVSAVNNYKDKDIAAPSSYTINDMATYVISIDVLEDGNWKPFKANDIQLEFVRIDPFVRYTLKEIKEGVYGIEFKIPDVYGVYQFKVDYDRVGYSRVYNTTQVSVRPLEHTQYERFIPSAFPYYVSELSMMIGVFIFSFVFLNFKEESSTKKSKSDDKKS